MILSASRRTDIPAFFPMEYAAKQPRPNTHNPIYAKTNALYEEQYARGMLLLIPQAWRKEFRPFTFLPRFTQKPLLFWASQPEK
ncbi:MAG: hypothetical protein IJ741_00060 [Schwartzia sp.]|nr:hypothetical protein [Schwartzia sp. (in: firmicutes)]